MKGIILVFLAIGLPLLVSSDDCNAREFFEFKYKYNKVYDDAIEEHNRCQIFTKNLNEVNGSSNVGASNLVKYEEGVTKFFDLTKEEFLKRNTGLKPLTRMNPTDVRIQLPDSLLKTLPEGWEPENEELDLRVSQIPVKIQGTCGSDWAFAPTGVFEYYLFKRFHIYYNLSEQMSVDCIREHGCHGGMMNEVFDYFLDKGVDFASVYPYKGEEQRCQYLDTHNPKNGLDRTFARKWYVAPADEKYLMYLLENVGWITVAISADSLSSYQSGILKGETCVGDINHAVILVGYGTDKETNTPYWILRNSWGPEWGENGYFRMERGVNACNIVDEFPNARLFLR
ncbi:hypothetical protein PVAND_010639 [Polypedilum vanderplanki]|uniref:Uncharacterized protein n=1 Tax=Polypedilum vanderplanki TaxID=319348 RepID=A0A9J6CGW7_POLVA|nr:hypothetical protein PVAND_010639 [Polypedilum vanderplanki]